MAIKLNGVEITSNKLNSSNVSEEKLNGVKVWPTAVIGNEWVYLFSSTSSGEYEQGWVGPYITYSADMGGDIEDMIYDLNSNYPPNNYAVGQIAIVDDIYYDEYYYFQVVQI